MDVTIREDDGVVLVELQGALDARGARDLERSLTERLRTSGVRLALDCAQIDVATGAGLRALVALSKRVLLVDGALVLYALDTQLLRVFDVSELAGQFTIVPTAVEAIAHLHAAAPAAPARSRDRDPNHDALRQLAARVLAALEGPDAPPAAALTLHRLRPPTDMTPALAARVLALLAGPAADTPH